MHIHKMKRKLILHGPSSLTVSLPAKWIQRNKLQKGDEIDLQEYGMDISISAKELRKENPFSIDISNLKTETVNKLLSCLHKNGYDTLYITCKTQQIKTIQKRINTMLLGYEIVEINNNLCVIKAISPTTDLEFEKLFRRVFLVTISFANNLGELLSKKKFGELQDLLTLEETNNKLTNYIHRTINQQFFSKERLSYIYLVSWLQEQIADDYKRLCIDLSRTKRLSPEFLSLLRGANSLLENLYVLFYNFDFNKLEEMEQKREALEEKLENQLKEHLTSEQLKTLLQISSIVKNIGSSLGSTIAYNN